MATRFAGDFFGVPLADEKEQSSELLSYFPELRSVKKGAQDTTPGARSIRDAKAAPLFTGFKTFEVGGGAK